MEDDIQDDAVETTATPAPDKKDTALCKKIMRRIEDDRKHHKPAIKRIREDMHMSMWGRDKDWSEDNYTANIVGRHVKMKTAALYAKNPRVVARRRPMLDFSVWEEDQQGLMMALNLIQQHQMQQQMAAQQPPTFDAATGMPLQPDPPPPMPGLDEAAALLQDASEGLERRKLARRIGRTLELLFDYSMDIQQPVDFKSSMKQMVRRTCTTGVGYLEVGFQRDIGPRPTLEHEMSDARQRLDHLQSLQARAEEAGDYSEDNVDLEEAQAALTALEAEPDIILKEGLVFDFPRTTAVIPDKNCTSLTGFTGSNHLTVEVMYTIAEVESRFGIKLDGAKVKTYRGTKSPDDEGDSESQSFWNSEQENTEDPDGELVCVLKHYDKSSGLMYLLCEGHDGFLRDPAPPDVAVEGFFPVYALEFNACENEAELYPPSDVRLLADMQREHNRSRQGMADHRYARQPRWAAAKGALSDPDKATLESAAPFTVSMLNLSGGTKLQDVLQAIPVPGVDPNLYETGQNFGDMQVVAGTQQAQLGGVSKSTATESAIAADSSSTADGASIDELDSFLTRVARAGGQVLFAEMTEEKVMEICGPGAVWPSPEEGTVRPDIYLEVEAGSMGKPNQAIEVKNWQMLLPYLVQMPGISPDFLAKETLRRLDDRLDLTEALVSGMPSIIQQNQMAQAGTGDPATDPNAQGAQGGDNAPRGQEGTAGSTAPMGDNRQTAFGPGDTGAAR